MNKKPQLTQKISTAAAKRNLNFNNKNPLKNPTKDKNTTKCHNKYHQKSVNKCKNLENNHK